MTNANQRIEYIDIAKGIGILLVVWGHISYNDLGAVVIYSFHMPLFFFLSGVVFRPEKYASAKEFLRRRLKTLILPYIIFSAATWCLWAGYYAFFEHWETDYLASLLETLWCRGGENYLRHNIPLWFVSCLFAVECIVWLLAKLKNRYCVIAVTAALGLAGILMMQEGSPLRFLPWSIDVAFCAVPFAMLGQVFGRSEKRAEMEKRLADDKKFTAAALLILVGVLLWSAVMSGTDRRICLARRILDWKQAIPFYPVACAGIGVTLILSFLIAAGKLSAVKKAFVWLGKNSFYIMAVHMPTLYAIEIYTAKTDTLQIPFYLRAFAVFCITMLLDIVLVLVIRKVQDRIHR